MSTHSAPGVDAVIFDWGGTLTAWHDIDFHAESLALAAAVSSSSDPHDDLHAHAAKLHAAGATVWGWSRDEQRSATVADLFEVAGLGHDPELLTAYREFWEPHTLTDPQAGPVFDALHERGLVVGVLSNTLWPRSWHRDWFARDGVLEKIDGDVYTSEIPWTKPSPQAFAAAMDALGVTDPGRCVYVGDRLFDDVWGAQNAGMRAIHVPHSDIPAEQVGHSLGVPDAVAHELADVVTIVAGFCSA